jgi:predicted regulator of Ras-like GTPase activity (Roadblock/LC7/MglB family)
VGIHVSALQHLLDEIIDIGALAVVLADSSGLVIANSLDKKSKDDILSESLGALSAIVIPQGEQVANYLATNGYFEDTVIHTKSPDGERSVLAFTIDSDPKTCLMIISDPALESQITYEIASIKDKIALAVKGMAVEIRDLTPTISGDKKVQAFWSMLESKINNSTSTSELRRNLLNAKEDFLTVHGSYSTVIYSMNAAAKRIDSSSAVDSQKTDLLQELKIWKRKILGSEEREESDELSKNVDNELSNKNDPNSE